MAAWALWRFVDLSWVRALAWLAAQWSFRAPLRTAQLLHGFARTEAQSQLELRDAARACPDERRRALYLRHALDEARHARAFAEHAEELSRAAGGAGFARPSAGSESLFERLGEPRFLAFVHAGERRGRVEFETYARLARQRGALALAQLFEGLIQDERQHEAYSARLLQDLAGPSEATRALAFARRLQAWLAFRRAGRSVSRALYGLTMLALYAALAPFALLFRLRPSARRGFSSEP
jgi:rubrerythrin